MATKWSMYAALGVTRETRMFSAWTRPRQNGNEISKQKWRNFLTPKSSQLIVLITNCNWYFLRTTFVKPTYRRYEHIKRIKLGSAAD